MPLALLLVKRPKLQLLEVVWGRWLHTLEIRHGGEVLATFAEAALTAGVTHALPDGSVLTARLVRAYLQKELQISRDGVPVSVQAAPGGGRALTAARALLFIGTVGLLGRLGAIFHLPFLKAFDFGSATAWLEIAALLVLGFFAQNGSLPVLLAGTAVVLFQDAYTVKCQLAASGSVAWSTLAVYVVFIGWLVSGIRGAFLLRTSARSLAP